MNTRRRIDRNRRNRRKRRHAAELRRHEMEVDWAPGCPSPAPQLPQEQTIDRATEERQWRATWGVER